MYQFFFLSFQNLFLCIFAEFVFHSYKKKTERKKERQKEGNKEKKRKERKYEYGFSFFLSFFLSFSHLNFLKFSFFLPSLIPFLNFIHLNFNFFSLSILSLRHCPHLFAIYTTEFVHQTRPTLFLWTYSHYLTWNDCFFGIDAFFSLTFPVSFFSSDQNTFSR